jgi:molecular chaperone DnaK (HSP70)
VSGSPGAAARFVVGIDLGTTNTALAAVDTSLGETARVEVEVVPIVQLVVPGLVEPRPTLPSFVLLPGPGELPAGAAALPWAPAQTFVVGELARARGAELAHRLVASAKSWLCHGGVDRNAAILPWGPSDDDQALKISPVEAATRTLAHVAGAWAQAHPDAPLGEQDVYLTVPASFDAVARELTVQAAHAAGLRQVTLLEEPQAAFYSWLQRQGDRFRKQLAVGDVILVCDVGGGTTDFSLIAVSERDGDLELERVAVGDHILLGGDNMDLALSYFTAAKLAERGQQLDAWQQRSLTQACRAAKEQLLGPAAPEQVPVAVLGRTSRVIGGSIKTELLRADVEAGLVDGFFPVCDADARPTRARKAGLAELGLPYAQDAAITRHLAEFLARHGRRPTAILFNGGVMRGEPLRRRLIDVIEGWIGAPGALKILSSTDLDLAVAHGAACYGLVRRGRGIRIRGGAARSYYVGVETAMPAVPGLPPPLKAICVVPFGMEEGSEADVPRHELGLVVGEPVEFRFLGSPARKSDGLGAVIEGREVQGLDELAPVEATLPADEGWAPGVQVPVRLRSHVTPIGTLELWCVARDGRKWKLEFSIRETEA